MAVMPATPLSMLGASIVQVKDYLSKNDLLQLAGSAEVLSVEKPDDVKTGLRVLKISQITTSEECICSRMASVYQAIKDLVDSCFLMIQGTKSGMSLYVGLHAASASTPERALRQTLIGNFPGIVLESLNATEISKVMDRMKSSPAVGLKTVAAVSVVPSARQESMDTPTVQGIEKLMETMHGSEFTAMILAAPYTADAVNQRILALESIYKTLSPLEKTTVQNTTGVVTSLTDSIARSTSSSISQNMNLAYSCVDTKGTAHQYGKGRGFSVMPIGLGITFQRQSGVTFSHSQAQGTTQGVSAGTNIGKSDTASIASTWGQNQSTTIVQTETNKEIQQILMKIDRQIQRLRESEVQGVWDCCGYFVSNANDTAIVAASAFQGIMAGDASNVDQSVLSVWQPAMDAAGQSNHQNIANLTDTLRLGVAPLFALGNNYRRTESIVTSRELSRMMGLPNRSAGDVAVIRMAEFGRKVHYLGTAKPPKDSFTVGHITHMGSVDQASPVDISIDALPAHTLVTGASGVGKTTLTDGIIQEVHRKKIPFTVIEPAKGEYGELWGELPDIQIYSTNPRRYRMLRLNPFAFGENTPLMEHMDRLICVFSTAWPLYAAQPAMLRECVRLAYLRCGWDTRNSVCLKKGRRFPTFKDVLAELPGVVQRSKFVGENRGTYEGALRTRLEMLTKDIYGEILSSSIDIPDAELFDRNVIIDLSRIGSPETLSLVMGVLLIRLYEHRIQFGKRQGLTHLTVLEEAHNILKRSVAAQQGETGPTSSAKAVEVLTKCIAELRFTGEGFLIADQSPGELDMAAIKNTSTKFVMRLQEASDQQAMGAALGLTEQQMMELGRLDRGSAVVMQEGWAEPVMTKLIHFKPGYPTYNLANNGPEAVYQHIGLVRARLVREVLRQWELRSYSQLVFQRILNGISGFSRWKLQDYADLFARYADKASGKNAGEGNQFWFQLFGSILVELLDCADLFEIFPVPVENLKKEKEVEFRKRCVAWSAHILDALDVYCTGLSNEEKKQACGLLILAEGNKKPGRIIIKSILQKEGVL